MRCLQALRLQWVHFLELRADSAYALLGGLVHALVRDLALASGGHRS